MARFEKLTEQQQLFERNKRIPGRTQKTLNEMIRKRFAELCDQTQPLQQRQQHAQHPEEKKAA